MTPDTNASNDRALLPSLLTMTAVTGLVDAVSFLGLGHIFTANMTGNVVFLGFALAGAPGLSVVRCSTAIAGFVAGAILGGRLAASLRGGPRTRCAKLAFAGEAILLAAAAFVSLRSPDPAAGFIVLTSPAALTSATGAVILLTALAMGLRNATIRSLGVADMTTTVLTLTITGLAADSTLAGGGNPRWPRRLASVLVMAAGAAIGAWLVRGSLALPLALCALAAGGGALSAHLRGRPGPAHG